MEVVPGAASDVPAVAELLARSFGDDPGSRLIFPARSRHPLLVAHFREMAAESGTSLLLGRCERTRALEACLVFHEEQRRTPNGWSAAHLVRLLAAPGALLRMAIAAPPLRRLERTARPRGAWTLAAIAVEPDLQGSGRGSTLLDHLLRRLDAAGAACYLETVAPRNLPFYRRRGFCIAGEVRPPGSVRTWAMVRPPPTAAASGAPRRGSTI